MFQFSLDTNILSEDPYLDEQIEEGEVVEERGDDGEDSPNSSGSGELIEGCPMETVLE